MVHIVVVEVVDSSSFLLEGKSYRRNTSYEIPVSDSKSYTVTGTTASVSIFLRCLVKVTIKNYITSRLLLMPFSLHYFVWCCKFLSIFAL
jgi:hypothetical protein